MKPIINTSDQQTELFLRHILELAMRSDKKTAEIAVSEFLSPREIYVVTVMLNQNGYESRFFFSGGYDGAERKRLLVIPEYMLNADDIDAYINEETKKKTAFLYIAESGYKRLTHRDYMGAILALGIKRGVIGDIITAGEKEGAYVVCDSNIADFIKTSLLRVGSDVVHISECDRIPSEIASRRTETVVKTASSMRIDSVTAAMTNRSREQAKKLISAGQVEINYAVVTKPDEKLENGDIVSVRGFGKFIMKGEIGVTRSDRIRFEADVYI